MTVTDAKKKLEQLEKDGLGHLPLLIEVSKHRSKINNINIEGTGIVSSAERVVIEPENNLWYA